MSKRIPSTLSDTSNLPAQIWDPDRNTVAAMFTATSALAVTDHTVHERTYLRSIYYCQNKLMYLKYGFETDENKISRHQVCRTTEGPVHSHEGPIYMLSLALLCWTACERQFTRSRNTVYVQVAFAALVKPWDLFIYLFIYIFFFCRFGKSRSILAYSGENLDKIIHVCIFIDCINLRFGKFIHDIYILGREVLFDSFIEVIWNLQQT